MPALRTVAVFLILGWLALANALAEAVTRSLDRRKASP